MTIVSLLVILSEGQTMCVISSLLLICYFDSPLAVFHLSIYRSTFRMHDPKQISYTEAAFHKILRRVQRSQSHIHMTQMQSVPFRPPEHLSLLGELYCFIVQLLTVFRKSVTCYTFGVNCIYRVHDMFTSQFTMCRIDPRLSAGQFSRCSV